MIGEFLGIIIFWKIKEKNVLKKKYKKQEESLNEIWVPICHVALSILWT